MVLRRWKYVALAVGVVLTVLVGLRFADRDRDSSDAIPDPRALTSPDHLVVETEGAADVGATDRPGDAGRANVESMVAAQDPVDVDGSLGGVLEFHGRLVDAETELPLTCGAVARATETEGPWSEVGPEGDFVLAWREASKAFGLAKSEGYGLALFAMRPEHASASTACSIGLSRGATLEVQVRTADGRECSGATVVVSAEASDLIANGLYLDRPQPARREWIAPVDRVGRARVEDLPPKVTLEVVAGAPGFVDSASTEPAMSPGEVRGIEVLLGPGCTVGGLLLDSADIPIRNHEIWLMRAEEDRPWLFRRYDAPVKTTTSASSSSGSPRERGGSAPSLRADAPTSVERVSATTSLHSPKS
jgi:hypothetical protein